MTVPASVLNADLFIAFKLQIFTLENGLQLAAGSVDTQLFKENSCCCDGCSEIKLRNKIYSRTSENQQEPHLTAILISF